MKSFFLYVILNGKFHVTITQNNGIDQISMDKTRAIWVFRIFFDPTLLSEPGSSVQSALSNFIPSVPRKSVK